MRFESLFVRVGFCAAACGLVGCVSIFALADTSTRAGEQLVHAARIAAARGQPVNVLRTWLAHVAYLDSGGDASNDAAMRSVLWWSVSAGGVCPDGLPGDEAGAGIWPVALHNYLVANLTPRRSEGRDTPSPFDAFLRGKQMRRVHRDDVLSIDEIASFRFLQEACGSRRRALSAVSQSDVQGVYAQAKDRVKLARAMQIALERARETVRPEATEGRSVLEARRFDLSLYLNDALARGRPKSASDALANAQKAPKGTAGEDSNEDENDSAPPTPEGDATRAFYGEAAGWSVAEWQLLSAERRLFLYDGARKAGSFKDEDATRGFALAQLDAAIARRDGADSTAWVARLDAESNVTARETVWKGTRGESLVALGPAEGFLERAALLIHRAIERLSAGDERAALRGFALAIAAAEDSSASDALRVQARRWLTFLLGTYRVNDDVLAVLRDALPREDGESVREELAWRAALRADTQGYKRLMEESRSRGAARGRLDSVEPLARGDAGAFLTSFSRAFEDDPTGAVKALDAFLAHTEREDPAVRTRLAPLLVKIRALALRAKLEGKRAESVAALVRRLDGVLALLAGVSEGGVPSSRALNPGASVFAGVVRAPPESDVPWPFAAKETQPPSVFTPLKIVPVDRRTSAGRVFGWRISE